MTPTESKRVYQAACRAKRQTFDDDEGRKWHRVLREFELCDVEEALDAWWADTTIAGLSGRPRGAFMPEPAELKPMVIAIRDKRLAAARKPKDYVRFECEGPERHIVSAYIDRGAPAPDRTCQYCGAKRRLLDRTAA